MIKAPNQFHPLRQQAAYDVRQSKAANIVSGMCSPSGWFDTDYNECKD